MTPATSSRSRGMGYMMVAALFFASMGACLKYVLDTVPLYQAIFFRSIVSSLIIGLVIFSKGLPYLGVNRKFLFARSITGFVAMSCGFFSLSKIPLADASVLHHSSPLFVALLGALFLREPVTKLLVFLIAICLTGVVLVLQPQWDVFNYYGLMALLSAMFGALAYVFVRHLHQTESSWVIAFHFTTLAALLSLPLMVFHFVAPDLVQWLALLSVGVLGTGGQLFMTAAYRYDWASRLAPFSYLSVILAFGYGMLFWGEVPNRYTLLGMSLLMSGGIAIARHRYPGRKTLPAEVSGP